MKKLFRGFIFCVCVLFCYACHPPSDVEMQTCSMPQFNPWPGAFQNGIEVSIVAVESGNSIRFTTNNETPTADSGILYTGPITISNSVTFKAIAYQTGYYPSDIREGIYTLESNLPSFSLVRISNWEPSTCINHNLACDQKIQLTFYGEILTNNLNSAILIYKYTNGISNLIDGTYDYSNRTVYFTPDTLFEPLTHYAIVVSNVLDTESKPVETTSAYMITSRVVRGFAHRAGHYYYNPITLKDNYLYAGTCGYPSLYEHDYDCAVYKLDTNFNLIWEYTLGMGTEEVISAIPIDSANNLYFISMSADGSEKGYLNKLDNNGNLLWKTNYGSIIHGWTPYSPAIGADDTVYVSAFISNYTDLHHHRFSALYAFNPDGTVKWSVFTNYYTNDGFEFLNYPIILDQSGNLYMCGKQYNESKAMIISYDSLGNFRWKTEDLPSQEGGNELASALALNGDDSRVYAFNRDRLYCVNTADGAVDWYFDISMWDSTDAYYIRSGLVIDENGVIYFGTKTHSNTNSRFYALNANGSMKWVNDQILYDFYNIPLFGADGNIYVFTENSGLSIVDRETGNRIHDNVYTSPYGADITHSSSVMDENGYIYVGCMLNRESFIDTDSGYILKWQTDAGGQQSSTAWPGFQGGDENLGRRH